MAYLVTTILIQLDDVLVKNDKAQQGRLQDITEQAIQNRLFGHGFLPEDAEVGSWEVQHTWVEDASGQVPFVLAVPVIEGEVLKHVSKDVLDYICGDGSLPDHHDDALRSLVDRLGAME